MKYSLLDIHTHTIASGHAYSTLMENAKAASEKGLKVLATTEHGVTMPGAPHIWYFGNYKVLPREMYGVTMLYGVEANIKDYDGNLDMSDNDFSKLDIVIGSIHEPAYVPGIGTIEENTMAFVNAIKSGKIDVVGHLGNPAIPVNYEEIVKCAKDYDVLIEINNSSFTTSRPGSFENCSKIASLCKQIGATIVINSDAHFCTKIGEFTEAVGMLKSIDFPDSLIINTRPEELLFKLKKKGKITDVNI